MKFVCPKCGKSFEMTDEALIEAQYRAVCPQCQSSLQIVGDYAYIPVEGCDLTPTPDDEILPAEPEAPRQDPLYDAAVDYVVTCNAITADMLCRYFSIPPERAMQLMDEMTANGVIAPSEPGAPYRILIPHNTNLPNMGDMYRRYDPDAPQTPPDFNIKQKTFSFSCSGCLLVLLITAVVISFFFGK